MTWVDKALFNLKKLKCPMIVCNILHDNVYSMWIIKFNISKYSILSLAMLNYQFYFSAELII